MDTIPILQHVKEDGKRIAVPKVYGNHMHFHQIAGLEDLKPGAYGILEPAEGEIFQPEHGIILVPGIVFDEKRAPHWLWRRLLRPIPGTSPGTAFGCIGV